MRWRRALDPYAWQNLGLEVDAAVRSLHLPPVTADPHWIPLPATVDSLLIRWPRETQPAVMGLGRMLAPVRRAIGRYAQLELADIPQPLGGVVITELLDGSRAHPVALDFHDLPTLRDEELVKNCLVYFKAQYRRGGYAFPQVMPGGHLTDKGTIYWYLRYLRDLRDRQDFACDVYGRFGLRFNAELRRQAVGTLSAQRRFDFRGGFDPVPRATFLKEMARSRVCIDLPGQADAISLRLISCLAIGACIVGPRPKNELPAPLIDRVHVAWTRDDQSDLVDLCEYYIENSDAREQMASEARRFFDQYLHADSLAAYYLSACVTRLANS
jgi:Glycosyl transferases group 1